MDTDDELKRVVDGLRQQADWDDGEAEEMERSVQRTAAAASEARARAQGRRAAASRIEAMLPVHPD